MIASIVALLVAQADTAKESARLLVDRGNQAMAEGRVDAAIEAYDEAYRTYPSPKILFNLAEARYARGDVPGAYADYDAFLRSERDRVEPHLVEHVEKQLGDLRARCGFVRFEGDLAGTTVSIRDSSSSRAVENPADARAQCVRPGTVGVQAIRGELSFSANAEIGVGQTLPIRVEFSETSSGPSTALWIGIAVGVAVLGIGAGVAVALGSDGLSEGELGSSDTKDWQRF